MRWRYQIRYTGTLVHLKVSLKKCNEASCEAVISDTVRDPLLNTSHMVYHTSTKSKMPEARNTLEHQRKLDLVLVSGISLTPQTV